MSAPYSSMVLLEENEYNELVIKRRQQDPDSMHKKAFERLESLNLPSDRYMKTYSTLRQSLKRPAEDFDETVTYNNAPIQELDIFNYLPRNHSNRGKQLTHYLMLQRSILDWDDKGQIKSNLFDTIPGSNIIDLISFMTATQKPTHHPIGLDEFIQILKVMNVPQSMLSPMSLSLFNKTKLKRHTLQRSKWISYD